MLLQTAPADHKLLLMNAWTVGSLAIVVASFSLAIPLRAADQPAQSTASKAATASLPDNEAQAKARAALYASEPVEPAKASPATRAAAAAQPAKVSTVAGPQPDNEAQAKARALLREPEPEPTPAQVASPGPEPRATPAATQVAAAPAATAQKSKQAARPANPLTAGMAPPALPTTADQQAQLDQLLSAYQADQISAAEYHQRRSEILAGR
jgi:hypothetical protein